MVVQVYVMMDAVAVLGKGEQIEAEVAATTETAAAPLQQQ